MLNYGPEQAGKAPLTDAAIRVVVGRARRAIVLRIGLALAWAGLFVGLALFSHGPILAVWHVGFSMSLMALGWAGFSLWRHFECARSLDDDLPRARALNLPSLRFWQAHGALFPLSIL